MRRIALARATASPRWIRALSVRRVGSRHAHADIGASRGLREASAAPGETLVDLTVAGADGAQGGVKRAPTSQWRRTATFRIPQLGLRERPQRQASAKEPARASTDHPPERLAVSPSSSSPVSAMISKTARVHPRSASWAARSCGSVTRFRRGTWPTCQTGRPKR